MNKQTILNNNILRRSVVVLVLLVSPILILGVSIIYGVKEGIKSHSFGVSLQKFFCNAGGMTLIVPELVKDYWAKQQGP